MLHNFNTQGIPDEFGFEIKIDAEEFNNKLFHENVIPHDLINNLTNTETITFMPTQQILGTFISESTNSYRIINELHEIVFTQNASPLQNSESNELADFYLEETKSDLSLIHI